LALILFLISAFTKSQLHSFPIHAAGNGSQSVTAHDASPASAFTRRPSRFSSPVHSHGLDAMGFTVHARLFQTKTKLLQFFFSFVGLIGGFGAKDAKKTVQECISEFIRFITIEYEIDIYFWFYF
jgi:hypothetical protein